MKGLFIQTYGCQMNVSDSDRMRAVLAPLGYENVKTPEEAELVLINTCSIRDKAESKTYSFAQDLKRLKKEKPNLILGVTGCVAQQEKESIQSAHPYIDMVLGPDNIDEIPWMIESLQSGESQRMMRAEFSPTENSRVWRTQTKLIDPGSTAFISIMKGCDHFCAYCVVPYTRGREKSRPIADVERDVRDLVAQGVKEVTFLGQNINTFGKRSGESLHELFYRVHDIEGLERIRFTTSHPGDLKDELIRCYEDLPKLCSYFHLPVQSGSNRILRMMRRFYTREQYIERAEALRRARPDIAISSDLIVGFPGETEEDFEATLSLAQQMHWDNVYSFLYSPRPGTSASTRPDDTTHAVKLERLMKLQNELRRLTTELHEAEVGKFQKILIESVSKRDSTKWTGRNSQNVPVHIERLPSQKIGDILDVQVIEGKLTHLKAVAIDPTAAQFQSSSLLSSVNST